MFNKLWINFAKTIIKKISTKTLIINELYAACKTEEKINAYKMYLILLEFIYKKMENPKILDVDMCIIKGKNDL